MCCHAKMRKFASKIEGGSSRCTSNGPTPYFGSVPVWERSIISTGIQKWCPYRYWHYKLVQYQYGHGPLPVLVFKNGARTSTGILAHWFSTGMGTVHYQYWHSKMVPELVLEICTLVQYRFGHSPLTVLAFSCACTGIGDFVLGISTSMGTLHSRTGIQLCPYQYWHFCTLVQYQYGHTLLLVLSDEKERIVE
jgi:hypothetical protein